MKRALVIGVATAWLMTACGPPHVAPFTPRHRKFADHDYAQRSPDARPSDGSLFSESTPGVLQDARAVAVGDILFVSIDESTNASGDASTTLNREGSMDANVTALLGLVPALKKSHPDIDPAQLISMMSKAGFAGDGKTTRKGELKGSIAVRVREMMPNGDLLVEGTKVVMINNEENHLYISGIVRSSDIGRDNSVLSSRIADAQVEFTGRGNVAQQTHRGWFAEFLDTVNPF